jgi:DNA repair exonuclease SbcCD ATPase subunit
MITLFEAQEKINQLIGKQKEIQSNYSTIKAELKEQKKLSSVIEETQVLLQQTAQETQNQLRFHLEDIMQTGLELCFPDMYTACVRFENKRGKTECDIFLENNEGCRINPITDNGGGVVDILSFSLRMACWAISSTDNLIILDEPFKFLSIELRPLAGELLQTLSEKLKLQIIMITHDEDMKEIADKTFIVKKNIKTEKSNIFLK